MSFASATKKYVSKKFRSFRAMLCKTLELGRLNRYRGAVGLRNQRYGAHWRKK